MDALESTAREGVVRVTECTMDIACSVCGKTDRGGKKVKLLFLSFKSADGNLEICGEGE